MRSAIKRASYLLSSLLLLGAASLWLTLPNVSFSASTRPAANRLVALDSQRQAALEKLHAQLIAGAPFAEEEKDILRTFEARQPIPDLDADVLISRALYDYYVADLPLSKEQHELLSRYTQSVSRRDHDIADRKAQLLKARQDAEIAAGPRTTPLVAPANDTCGGAEVIPATGPFPYLTTVTGDITDATSTGDPGVPSCQTSVSRSIWYRFTPNATAVYTISSCADAPTGTTVDDTVMAIYTSSTSNCGGTYTQIPNSADTHGCDDDSCAFEALQAVITTRLDAGTSYFIVVWEFGTTPPTPGNTAVQLRVSQVLPPSNDSCASPTALTLNTPVTGTTDAALNDYQLSGSACFTGVGQTASTATGRDVVYSFTAAAAANYSFRVTGYDMNKNLVLYVASTCPAGIPPVTVATCLAASNRDPSSTSEEVQCLPLSASQQVFVFVDDNALAAHGSTFTIEVTSCNQESEPNNTPATANAVTLPVMGIEGSIGTGGDVDFFALGTVAAGSRVFAMVDGVAANAEDFDLRLTTTTDTLQYDDNSNDSLFGSASPNIGGTPTPNSSIPLFLRVNNFAATASEPYRLYAVVQPPGSNAGCNNCSATTETEPNDKTQQANSAANNYFYGTLAGPAPSTDVDMYRFLAQAGTLVYLGLDGDPLRNNTPINAQLELLDSNGASLVLVNDPRALSSTTSGAGSLTATTPFSPGEALVYRVITSGTYYAKVSIGTSSSDSTGAGDYLLSISATAGGALPFVDVLPSNPFYSSIAEAYFSGLTNGTTATTYSPTALVTREQMAAFIGRTLDQALKRGSERAVADQNWTNQGGSNLALTTVGTAPGFVKSDGVDLWVATNAFGTVLRVRASDGRLLETWTGAGGAGGVLIAMGKVWIAGETIPGKLYQIDPAQAAGLVTTVTSSLGDNSGGIAFDGERVWTANNGNGAPNSGSVSIVTLPSSVNTVTTGFSQPLGIIYDGTNIWVTDVGDNTLKKLDSNGNIVQTISVGLFPSFPVFDGTNIWVPNRIQHTVSVVRATGILAGTVLATLTGNGLGNPVAASFDGERILVTNFTANSISLWRASDLTPMGTFSTGASSGPEGACSDGLNFWITLSTAGKLARF
jgi:S-layer family protein